MQPPLAITPARQRLRTWQGSCKVQMLPVEHGAAFRPLGGSTGFPALQLVPLRGLPGPNPPQAGRKRLSEFSLEKKIMRSQKVVNSCITH